MSETPQTQGILDENTERLKAFPQVVCAVAYGSVNGPYFTVSSGIDVAIITDPLVDEAAVYNVQQSVSVAAGRDVDLVQISPALSLILANEIARHGELLFSKDKGRSLDFFIVTPQMHRDFMRLRNPLEDAYIERSLREPSKDVPN